MAAVAFRPGRTRHTPLFKDKTTDMKKFLFLLLAAVLCTAPLRAQVSFTDIAIPAGEDVLEVSMEDGIYYFRFVADRDGVLNLNVGHSGIIVYSTDVTGEESTLLPSDYQTDGKVFYSSVSRGETYLFKTSILLDPVTMRVYYEGGGQTETPISVSSSYADGDTYTLTGGNLELTFDRRVSVAAHWLCFGDGEQVEIPAADINATLFNQYYYSIVLRNVVSSLVDAGRLAEGDAFTVRLEGIADADDPTLLYGTDGTFELRLVLGAVPATLLSVDPADGSYVSNYYPEGGADNLFTFTFSDELDPASDVDVAVSYGDVEAGTFVEIACAYAIEGNRLVVDLTGNRFPETVTTSRGGEAATVLSFTIRGLCTADGRAISPNYEGAGTSAILAFYTVQKEQVAFYADFSPYAGAPLFGCDEVLIWLSSPVTYSGIRVDWYNVRGGEQSRTFTPGEVPFFWDDAEEGYVAHVPLDGIGFGDRPVTVTVLDAVLVNGDPAAISATFNENVLGISDVTPAVPAVVSLYSTDGRLLRRAPADVVLDGLAPGVYIVGGRKVAVK